MSFTPFVGHLAVKLSSPVQATLKVMIRSGFERFISHMRSDRSFNGAIVVVKAKEDYCSSTEPMPRF